MKSVLLVAALLSSTAGAAFAELQSNPGLPGNFVLGADGQYYFYPNAGMLRAAAGTVPGTVIGPDAAGRYLNLRAPGGPQRQGRALTNTDDPRAVLAHPLKGGLFLLDLANPFSGDGFGSPGNVGRSLGFNGVPYSPQMAPVVVLDTLNPFSGNGVGSPGVVGRELAPYGAGQQVVVPGRWLSGAGGILSEMGEATFGTTSLAEFALAEEFTAGTMAAGAGAALGLGALAASAGTFVGDLLNPWSGDGFGSRGAAGRGLVPYGAGQQAGAPDQFLQQASAPGRWLSETTEGAVTMFGSLLGGVGGGAALMGMEVAGVVTTGAAIVPVGLGLVGGPTLTGVVDLLNPFSGDGVGSPGEVGRGLASPVGATDQMPYYSTGNAGMVPVQYDVGPQGTTISITIPNGYNVGQMGMMPMVPAMSAPQYRVIPQYAAPAPVAYAAPAPVAYAAPTMPANLAVAPAAANAGVKCQVGDQQALALTVDACEEAGGLVQPMDAAQAAE